MTYLTVQIIVLFLILLLYFSSTKFGDNNDWKRALILAAGLTLLGFLPAYLGIIGWVAAVAVSLVLISKVAGQSLTGSVLFLIVIGIIQYFVQLGIARFI